MDQKSTLDVGNHADDLCSITAVKRADCAAPRKFIHAVSDSCAGYLFSVHACKFFTFNFILLVIEELIYANQKNLFIPVMCNLDLPYL